MVRPRSMAPMRSPASSTSFCAANTLALKRPQNMARHVTILDAVTRASATFGFGDLAKDRYNAFAVVSYQKEKALFGRDRAFAASGINLDNLNDTTSGNTFPANVVRRTAIRCAQSVFSWLPGPYATVQPAVRTDWLADLSL